MLVVAESFYALPLSLPLCHPPCATHPPTWNVMDAAKANHTKDIARAGASLGLWARARNVKLARQGLCIGINMCKVRPHESRWPSEAP